MLTTRVIPCLLMDGKGLIKTVQFKSPKYIGDPINAVKIFNDKFVDEIIFLDISATRMGQKPNFDLIEQIATECFIPFCYGGGIACKNDAIKLFKLGVEKVSINSAAIKNPDLIVELSEHFGRQSIVVAMDVKKYLTLGYRVVIQNGTARTKMNPIDYARKAEELGAGELLINSVDGDGKMQGYDLNLLKEITAAVSIPVIACGGAGNIEHMAAAVRIAQVSAVAAGSLFVFKGKHRAVLINYPSQKEMNLYLK